MKTFLPWLLMVTIPPGVISGETDFRLAAPQVLKVDWQTRALCSGDLDGDGRTDLALINNEKAQIELFYQLAPGEMPGKRRRQVDQKRWEPVLDDGRFERDKIFTGGETLDLALGDLNGDERLDLVYSNERDEIVIHFQEEDGKWSKALKSELENMATYVGTLKIADLRGDGRPDLLVAGNGNLKIFPDGKIEAPPEEYPTAFSSYGKRTVADFNRDGRLDLGYWQMVRGESYYVVRLQDAEGGFTGEMFFSIDGLSGGVEPFGEADGARPEFVSVSTADGTLQNLIFRSRPGSKAGKAGGNRREATAYAVPGFEGGDSRFAVADIDGDGRSDVAASDGESARIWVFFQNEADGFSAPKSYPAYDSITSLAAGDVDGDGRSELILLSESEKALGVSSFDEGRLSFPVAIPLDSEPRAVAAADLDRDGRSELVVAREGESSRTYGISVLAKKEGGGWLSRDVTGKNEVRSRMEDIRFGDVDQDGRLDVLAVSSSQPAMIFLQDEEGKFREPFEGDEIAPESLSSGDMDGDGRDELLLTQESFVRSVRSNGEGGLSVVDQVNAPVNGARLLSSVFIDADGDGSEELVLVDRNSGALHVMYRDENGVFRQKETLKTVVDSFLKAHTEDLNGDGGKELLLFGEGHFWRVPLELPTLAIRTTRLHETDIADMDYETLMTGDLDGDGRHDIVAIDNASDALMEILLDDAAVDESGARSALRSAMHFKLFEKDRHYRGRQGGNQQPHDGLLADLDNDGKLDITLLLHDRLLIYLQL